MFCSENSTKKCRECEGKKRKVVDIIRFGILLRENPQKTATFSLRIILQNSITWQEFLINDWKSTQTPTSWWKCCKKNVEKFDFNPLKSMKFYRNKKNHLTDSPSWSGMLLINVLNHINYTTTTNYSISHPQFN